MKAILKAFNGMLQSKIIDLPDKPFHYLPMDHPVYEAHRISEGAPYESPMPTMGTFKHDDWEIIDGERVNIFILREVD